MVIPGFDEYLPEKQKLLDWFSYNTPISNDPIITPITGTGAGLDLPIPQVKYNEWMIASAYLLYEYDIWKKAIYYVENKNNSLEFKQAYNYFILRQFKINQFSSNSFNVKNLFIRDYLVNDIVYRELCEDLLYILLNLLLADKIIGNLELENLKNNKDKFFHLLKNIIKNHYNEHKDGYSCLNDLRWYTLNNYLTEYNINYIIKNII